ncbi:MAG: KamA family radical SAM protein [Proteobacteria bacterium]|nr:KamA family radical SAM protein [Pseudomonadota bacterium]
MEELLKINHSVAWQATQKLHIDPDMFLSWTWQMNHQIRSLEQAESFFGLNDQERQGFIQNKDIFEIGITPYYAFLSARNGGHLAMQKQVLPSTKEFIDPDGLEDPLHEKNQSPVKEVVHIYPDRVAFCVAQLCPVYCRYCFRKRRDKEHGLHFHRHVIKQGLEYIASQTSISDVLITGGDPFLASDEAIESLISALRDISHVKIIRFGTRTPVALPYRLTKKFTQMLKRYHPIWVNTHFNCQEEITPDAALALANLSDAGIPLGNQSVLLRGVNDSWDKLASLCRQLTYHRVRPYYMFHANLVQGTQHLRVPIKTGLELIRNLRGKISGFAIPSYILDTPSGKIPLNERNILDIDGNDVLLESNHGEIWREKNAWI